MKLKLPRKHVLMYFSSNLLITFLFEDTLTNSKYWMTLSILLLQLINVQVKKLSESNEAVCAVFMPNNKL